MTTKPKKIQLAVGAWRRRDGKRVNVIRFYAGSPFPWHCDDSWSRTDDGRAFDSTVDLTEDIVAPWSAAKRAATKKKGRRAAALTEAQRQTITAAICPRIPALQSDDRCWWKNSDCRARAYCADAGSQRAERPRPSSSPGLAGEGGGMSRTTTADVYRRMHAAMDRRRGIRLTYLELAALVDGDHAVRTAMENVRRDDRAEDWR